MGTTATKCAFCSAPLPLGALFCDSCGRRVEDASVGTSPTIAARPVSRPATRPFAQVSPASAEAPADDFLSQEVRVSSTGVPFELSAALPMALKVGRRSLVYVRFRALTDRYESVEFVLRNGTEELCRRPCGLGRPGTQEHKKTLEVIPKFPGEACVELDVVCCFGKDESRVEEVHTAKLQLRVEEKVASAFSPVFNIHQEQDSDRAGRTEGGDINVNFGGLQLQQDNNDSSRYDTDPNALLPLEARLQKSPARLTLVSEDDVVQLISDRVITFGRNRDNTVVLRVCGADGRVDRPANENNISRFHFRIEAEGRDCRLRDGDTIDDPERGHKKGPSSYGTRLDGEELPGAGCVSLMSGRDIALCIGRKDVELRMRLHLYCDAWRVPQGFVIDRKDGAKQRICAVWREVPLNGREKIEWNGSSWSFVGTTGCVPLAIGMSVSMDGKSFAVLPFYQTHVN